MTCCIETGKVVGVVREVGIHLEYIVVVVLKRPLESGDVCRTKSQLARTFLDEEPVGKLGVYESVYNGSRAVGTSVVNDKDVETLVECEHRTYDILYVLLLIICGNDNYAVAIIHICVVE